MSDRLTFLWFVCTCNLGHPATGPQEALWNTVKECYGCSKKAEYVYAKKGKGRAN
jgi:hypothetical protein